MQKLREFRKRLGLTQEELGARVGQTQGAISKIETGETVPTVELAARLAVAMNINPRDLTLGLPPCPGGGFSECPVTAWEPRGANGSAASMPINLHALAPNAQSPATFIVAHDRAISFGLPRNTVVVIDLGAIATDGQLAVGNVIDPESGEAFTALGRRLGDFLVGPQFGTNPADRIVIDGQRVSAVHPVVAYFSAPSV
jgi:transcriptional regulator with XRE-family HTH domain